MSRDIDELADEEWERACRRILGASTATSEASAQTEIKPTTSTATDAEHKPTTSTATDTHIRSSSGPGTTGARGEYHRRLHHRRERKDTKKIMCCKVPSRRRLGGRNRSHRGETGGHLPEETDNMSSGNARRPTKVQTRHHEGVGRGERQGGEDSGDSVVVGRGQGGVGGFLPRHMRVRPGGSYEVAEGEEAVPHYRL